MIQRTILATICIICSGYVFSQFDINVAKDLNPENLNQDYSEYDRKTAIFNAQLSNIVYESESDIHSYVESLNLLYPDANYKYQFINHVESSTEAMFFGNQDFLIIAFRGTQESKDFVTDAKFLGYRNKLDSTGHTDFPHLPTGHAGFRRYLMNLISTKGEDIFTKLDVFIDDSLKQHKDSIPIFLTGHSLGAALSNMFILPLKNRGYNYSGSYNFAPPLGIWNDDAKKIRLDASIYDVTYDIVNNTDYITRLPRYSRKNMMHIGKFYRICSNNPEELPLIYRENETFYKYRFLERFMLKKALFDKYHRMKYYLDGVKNVDNELNQITERSKEIGDCSCLNRNCD